MGSFDPIVAVKGLYIYMFPYVRPVNPGGVARNMRESDPRDPGFKISCAYYARLRFYYARDYARDYTRALFFMRARLWCRYLVFDFMHA